MRVVNSAGTAACPALLSPQHTGVPPAVTAHVWLAPATSDTTAPVADRLAGGCAAPGPAPQHTTPPVDASRAQLCRAPAATAATWPPDDAVATAAGSGDTCPPRLSPQHVSPPAVVTAHACATPAASDRTAPTADSAGGKSVTARPPMPPQQYTADACDSAHANVPPHATVRMPHPADGGTSVCPSVYRPQHTTRPQSSTAHAWPSPAHTRALTSAAHAMPATPGAGVVDAETLGARVRVLVTVAVGVNDDVGELDGVPAGDAGRVAVLVPVPDDVLVPDAVRVGDGVRVGVGLSVADDDGAGSVASHGGSITPR